MIVLIVAGCGIGTAVIVFLILAYFRPDLIQSFFHFPLQIRHDYEEIENQSRDGHIAILARIGSRSSENSLSDNEILDNLINECDLEAKVQAQDIRLIGQQLNNFNREQAYLNQQALRRLGVNTLSITERACLPLEEKQPLVMEDINIARCDEMISSLIELWRTSPQYPDEVTIESVQEYKDASKIHHEKLISLATVLFPELQSLLNEQKQAQNEDENIGHLASTSLDSNDQSTNYRNTLCTG